MIIVGIDEVGRGPLAGPVTVGAVACDAGLYAALKRDKRLPPLGKDSKKLSSAERDRYVAVLKSLVTSTPTPGVGVKGITEKKRLTVSKSLFDTAVVHISHKVIDSKGLAFAIRKAVAACLRKLDLDPTECQVLLDGGLKAPAEFKKQTTIIKGDEKEKIIAWASILAKVSRDALMARAAKKFPAYGFEIHKGYGTAAHRRAISRSGLSVFHRKSFCKSLI
jgi:ribonuclease HII